LEFSTLEKERKRKREALTKKDLHGEGTKQNDGIPGAQSKV